MKLRMLISMSAATLLAALTLAARPAAQEHFAQDEPPRASRYTVTDLGPTGSLAGGPFYISPNGLISGSAPATDGSAHATLWYQRFRLDIGIPGLGGSNSIAFGVNASGQAVGGAETNHRDPMGADFCGFRAYGLSTSDFVCAPFLWQRGVITPLPTLGGNNGTASQINRWGTAAGEAENTTLDPDCPHKLQFKPVTWVNGAIHELPTHPGDPDAVAYAINDKGQVVGSSGTCADFNPNLQLSLHPLHPILWEPDGSAIDLKGLGGTGYGFANLAINLNNRGHVVGTSDLPGDVYGHAFFWSRKGGIKDLGTLPGDVRSGAVSINDSDTVVGLSLDPDFNARAFVWQNGVMHDLNSLVSTRDWYLTSATSINDDGQIVGFAVNKRTGEPHGFLATPRNGEHR
jgi:probable HAF family extracellular repeat protein